jgi:SAM-dependent methyltransferase
MLRYLGASVVANAFSATPTTQRSYRKLANGLETWRRTRMGLPELYVTRIGLLASFIERNLNLTADSSVLEIGTGWVHWESLITSLVCDARVTMFDVVDNRLFQVFKLYVEALRPSLDTIGLPAGRIDKAHALLEVVEGATSFQQVYSALSWDYVIDPSGTMEDLGEGTFDLIVSSDVLEHIDRAILRPFIEKMFRLLRPGALTYHSIDLIDHLSYYDPKAPAKLYYRFDGAVWDKWVNSKVQYINRVQRPEWLSLFREAGFDVVSEDVTQGPHGNAKVHPSYASLSATELEMNTLMLAFRKPG